MFVPSLQVPEGLPNRYANTSFEIMRVNREWAHALAKHPAAAFCPGTNLRFR